MLFISATANRHAKKVLAAVVFAALFAALLSLAPSSAHAATSHTLSIQLKCGSVTTPSSATFDVYVKGKKVANDVTSFKKAYSGAFSYKINDIKAKTGYQRLSAATISGSVKASSPKTVTVAVKMRKKPIVTFNANGGTGTMAKQYVAYFSPTVLSANKFKRTGYTFTGWALAKNAAISYKDKYKITTAKNRTLYAKWKVNTYSVTFDANGGTGTMAKQSIVYNTSKALSANKFKRTGYTFAGWSTTRTGTVAYADKASFKCKGNAVLYAKWKANTYSVTFDANGGMGTMAKQSIAYDATKPLNANKFARADYNFVGWSTTRTGAVAYADKASFKCKGNAVLYAQWVLSQYTVSFNPNDGEGELSSVKVDCDAAITLPAGPVRENFEFAGWSTSPEGADRIQPGEQVAIHSETTFYAIWTPLVSFNIGLGANSVPTTFDVMVSGVQVADDVTSYSAVLRVGTEYSIDDVKVPEEPHAEVLLGARSGIVPEVDATIPVVVVIRAHDFGGAHSIVADPETGEDHEWTTCSVCGLPTADLGPVGAQETGEGQEGVLTFSKASGAYAESAMKLALSCPGADHIAYTVDGSIPSAENGFVYDPVAQITVHEGHMNPALLDALDAVAGDGELNRGGGEVPTATVIRACAVFPDGTCGDVQTHTYFMGRSIASDFNCMTISLTTDPANLFEEPAGIMLPDNQRNSGKEWERWAHIELFDCSDTTTYEGDCGIRLRGAWSRYYIQHGFNIYFRADYGDKNLKYPLFDANVGANGKVISKYKQLSLRNGGNARTYYKFHDSMFQKLVKDGGYDNVATQASRMAAVFLNGEYYGAMSLNEKYCGSYFESHYGVNSDDVVIFDTGQLDEGVEEDKALYNQLRSYRYVDLSDPAAWESFKQIADIDSMARYYAAEIYLGNYDWGEQYNNYRIWRSRSADGSSPYADGKWRWIIYDFEYAAGLYGEDLTRADYNTLANVAMTRCPVFVSALRNPEFRELFYYYLADMGTRVMSYDRTRSEFDVWKAAWAVQHAYTANRYCNQTPEELAEDEQNLDAFFRDRYTYMIGFENKLRAQYGDPSILVAQDD